MSKTAAATTSPIAYDPRWTVEDLNLKSMFGLDEDTPVVDTDEESE